MTLNPLPHIRHWNALRKLKKLRLPEAAVATTIPPRDVAGPGVRS